MKNYRSLSLILLLVITSIRSSAQFSANTVELSGGYGILSATQILQRVSHDTYRNDNNADNGVEFVSVKYFVSKRLALGLNVSYQTESGKFVDYYYTSPYNYYFYDVSWLTISPEFLYLYVNQKNFACYTYIGIGYVVTKEKDTDGRGFASNKPNVGVNGQICPIGFRFGEKVAFFAELGFGYKGVVNAGLSIKFSKKATAQQTDLPKANHDD